MPAVEWKPDVALSVQQSRVPPEVKERVQKVDTGAASAPAHDAQGAPAATPAPAPQDEESAKVDRVLASEDAAEWNSLLVWARQKRGPQWDMGTGVYVGPGHGSLLTGRWQVPRGSHQYYRCVPKCASLAD